MSLVALEEAQTFPPKVYFLVVWVLTFLFALFGVVVSVAWSVAFWIWIVIMGVSFRQIWTTRWIRIDEEGIRSRNFALQGKELSWNAISDVDEREIPVRKDRAFYVLKISGTTEALSDKETTITIDSDTVGFDILRDVIQNVVGSTSSNVQEEKSS